MKGFLSALTIIFSTIGGAVNADQIYAASPEFTESDVAKIQSVILGQLDAFRRDDAQKAFSYAAPLIKERFKTPKKFLKMVRRSYISVYRPRDFEFQPIQVIDERIVQPLAVTGPLGVQEIALYIVERQPNHSWKISGCIMVHGLSEKT